MCTNVYVCSTKFTVNESIRIRIGSRCEKRPDSVSSVRLVLSCSDDKLGKLFLLFGSSAIYRELATHILRATGPGRSVGPMKREGRGIVRGRERGDRARVAIHARWPLHYARRCSCQNESLKMIYTDPEARLGGSGNVVVRARGGLTCLVSGCDLSLRSELLVCKFCQCVD